MLNRCYSGPLAVISVLTTCCYASIRRRGPLRDVGQHFSINCFLVTVGEVEIKILRVHWLGKQYKTEIRKSDPNENRSIYNGSIDNNRISLNCTVLTGVSQYVLDAIIISI